jgi:putative ABC transport system permease protein
MTPYATFETNCAITFSNDSAVHSKAVNMLSKTGYLLVISSVAEEPPGKTYLRFDCVGFSDDIIQGKD